MTVGFAIRMLMMQTARLVFACDGGAPERRLARAANGDITSVSLPQRLAQIHRLYRIACDSASRRRP
ncbi:hypothetical protein EVAR_33211_1 [Eumeta japonica]|uniref:Uncharacterized protein n=1 Tax=Eumeta variegata TaxID=151549 RepID=A0A4C1W0P2_EUMVA|nr:hypothetical protein EVAR_33211_1 [Eumeta japonica]